MLYYKVPITDGQTDCSAGSVLCCAYPQGNYMICKFESVSNVGSNWVEITAEEFEANCPDFPDFPAPLDTLPMASADTLGGVKIGEGLAIDENGVLSVTITGEISAALNEMDEVIG